MKAKPMKRVGESFTPCKIQEAEYIELCLPGPFPSRWVPVILKGSRSSVAGAVWSWNGDTEKPTLKPSIATTDGTIKCHIWINDGKVIFLNDCTHDLAGQTLEMNEVK